MHHTAARPLTYPRSWPKLPGWRLTAGLLALACSGGGPGSMGPPAGDALGEAGTGDQSQAGDSAGAPTDASSDALPAMSRRLVAGRVTLVGTPSTACNQPRAGGDRWCAFSQPGSARGKTALWVINLSKAVVGSVSCTGSGDSSCLRLTDDLWTGAPSSGPAHPFSHRFDGETLIFYSDMAARQDIYRGPIFAWRPGWIHSRQITGNAGFTCSAHARGDAVVCIENLQDTNLPLHFDLHAGRLGGEDLPLVSRIYPLGPNGENHWLVDFSPDDAHVAYSTGGPTATDPETLHVVSMSPGGARTTLATGASVWRISPDGKRIYFLRDYNHPHPLSTVDPSGVLSVADFPSGANATQLAPGVGAYVTLEQDGADRGVAFLDTLNAGSGAFKILRDPSNPAGAVTVATGVSEVQVSPDLRYSIISTLVSPDGTRDAHVIKNDGTGRCTLAGLATADFFGPAFLPGAGMVFWSDNIDLVTGAAEGWRANPDGCRDRNKFADSVDFWFSAGDLGLVYSDEARRSSATVRFAKLGSAAQWPEGGPVTIRTGVAPIYAPLAPDRNRVVFTVNDGSAEQGLYVYGPIGFGAP